MICRRLEEVNLPNDPAGARGERRARDVALRLRPWLGVLAVWLAVGAIAGFALFKARQDAVRSEKRELGLLSLALADEIDRGLAATEEGFAVIRGELHDGRLALSGKDASLQLRTRADLMPLIASLWVFDRQGRLLMGSDASQPPELTGFAPTLDRLQEGSLSIGRPYPDGPGHQTQVAFAVRFADAPEAADGGWVVGAAPSSALLGAFSSTSLAPDVRVAVFRDDGTLLAAANAPSDDESRNAPWRDTARAVATPSMQGDEDNLVWVRSVPRHPIRVVVERSLGSVLAEWFGATQLTCGALVLLLGVMLAAVHLVSRADRRRAQAQLDLQAQRSRANRLESLGTLAGGVAHDFNNVLAGIIGFAEMAQDAAPPDSDQARHLGKAMEAALRGKALASRILAFSAGGAQARTVFALRSIVEEVLDLITASLRPGIVLERALDISGGRVRGDPMQAFEAVLNLCDNAIRGSPNGGIVKVRLTSAVVGEPRVLSHSELAPGDYVALAVMDQGPGVGPAAMEHLFEPFYTTRKSEGGTGMGLAVVRGVVAEFGGGVDVRSEPGGGATFTLYFPESQASLTVGAWQAETALPGNRQAVLFVDDEPELVEMGIEMLRGLGYEPTGVSDPLEALARIQDDPSRYAALITDESMPGVSGTELASRARRAAPNLPVLVVSGYGGALLAQRVAAAGAAQLLTKPVHRVSLAAALKTLLA